MNSTVLLAVAVVILALWGLLDALEHLEKTVDVLMTGVAGALAVVAAIWAYIPVRR